MAVTNGLLVNSKVTYDGTLALANGAAVVNDGCNVTNNGSLLLGPSATYTNIRGTLVDGASSLTGVTVLGSGSSSTMTGGSVSGGGTLKLTTLGTLKMGATAKPITSTTLTGTFRTLGIPERRLQGDLFLERRQAHDTKAFTGTGVRFSAKEKENVSALVGPRWTAEEEDLTASIT